MNGKGSKPRSCFSKEFKQNYDEINWRDKPKTRRGWRYFHCTDCKHTWEEKSRDCTSPSGDNCPNCGDWLFPVDYVIDERVAVDKFGNLIN